MWEIACSAADSQIPEIHVHLANRPILLPAGRRAGLEFGFLDNNERLISELSRVLSRRGLSVRSEQLWGMHPGAKCRLKGKTVLLLNTKAPAVERLIVVADCVVEEPTDDVELSMEARALLQRRIARRSDIMAPAAATRPGLAKGPGPARKQRRI
jgi:hypothetical protein